MAKTKHGKNIETLHDALLGRKFFGYPIVVSAAKAREINSRGYKRYHDEQVILKGGQRCHVTNQITAEGFRKFIKHLKTL